MFDNILGQKELTERLGCEFLRGELPGSLLFAGPPLSAKLSTALELARVLSCDGKALWSCTCSQCIMHRTLSHPDVLVLGPKAFREELHIAAEMLGRNPGAASRYFFVRSARKLIKRFDRALYEGEENRLNKILPLLNSVSESIFSCLPEEAGGLGNEDAKKEADKLLASLFKLEEALPESTAVFQLRAMGFWSRLAPLGRKKTVIIEHADTMLESSRNAILKILEEPPEHCTFILTTSRKQAIIPTVLSRLRPYQFLQRNEESSRLVIKRIFRNEDSNSSSLESYINSHRSISGKELYKAAADFMLALSDKLDSSVFSGHGGSRTFLDAGLLEHYGPAPGLDEAMENLFRLTKNFGAGDDAYSWTFAAFLEKCSEILALQLRHKNANTETIRLSELFNKLAKDAMIRKTDYKLQGTALCQRLAGSFLRFAAESRLSGREVSIT